ncbi:MAG: hypothetical protein ACI4ET_09880 [Bilifractor sp.]
MVSIDKYLKNDPILLKYARGVEPEGSDRIRLMHSDTVIVFPVENSYMMRELLEGFGKNGREYDFTAYDQILDRTWMDARRAEMILMRLKYPLDLSPAKAEEYQERVAQKLQEILKRIVTDRNFTVLKLLAEEGFFTSENVESCIATLRSAGGKEMMLWLMNWKNQHFGSDTFDFTL